MSIPVTCPSGHQLLIADNMAGRSGRCPFCREVVHVPAMNGPAPAVSPPPLPMAKPISPINATPVVVAPAPSAKAAPSEAATPDTVLMPLSFEELSSGAAALPFDVKSLGEPDSPVAAEPDLMSQTLPLPTAELMPKKSATMRERGQEITFDTVAQKGRIVGAWKILSETVPPYIPESAAGQSPSAGGLTDDELANSPAARAFADAELAIASPPGGVSHVDPSVIQPAPMQPQNSPPASESAQAPTAPQSAAGAWRTGAVAQVHIWPLRPTVSRIAAAAAILSLLCIWPAARYWDLGAAPVWARAALLLAVLELAYAAWLVSIPDSASLWAAMFVLAIVATLYGTAAALVLATPIKHALPLGLDQSLRSSAPVWCFEIMLATLALAYLCGHASLRTDSSGSTERAEVSPLAPRPSPLVPRP